MSEYIGKDEILQFADILVEEVVIPEWNNKKVRVASLSGTERDALEASILEHKNGKQASLNLSNLRAKLVAHSVVDADGKRVFSDEDIVKLGTKNAAALSRIFQVAQRLSGITEQDVEDLTKN